jgi:hypothetical protein
MLLSSALFVPAFGDAGSAQQVRSERLLGGNETAPVISDGTGSFRATFGNDQASFRLRYDVASEEDMALEDDVEEDAEEDAEEDVVEEDIDAALSDITQAHLHIATPGNDGEIVVFLCSNLGNTPDGAAERECPPSPGVVQGEILPEDVLPVDGIIGAGDLDGLAKLVSQGAVYVNVHTDDHPTGEIRGQTSPRRR